MNEYLNVVTRNYVNFAGRARRREYWMFVLINLVISAVLSILDQVLFGRMNDGAGMPVLAGIYGLSVLLPSLGVGVRRLHDTGRSGWWLLLSLIPLIGALVLLVFYVQDSQPGANKWGPNPKAVTGGVVTTSANW